MVAGKPPLRRRGVSASKTHFPDLFPDSLSLQGEMVQRIDDNTETSLSNVQAGQNELLKYLNSISGNRWLIGKIFVVLLVFATLFMVFFV